MQESVESSSQLDFRQRLSQFETPPPSHFKKPPLQFEEPPPSQFEKPTLPAMHPILNAKSVARRVKAVAVRHRNGFGLTMPAPQRLPRDPDPELESEELNYIPLEAECETVPGKNGTWPRIRRMHRMWRVFSGTQGTDVQGDGLKNTLIAYCSVWGLGATLVMTVCFSFLVVNPLKDLKPGLPFGEFAVSLFLFYNFASALASVQAIRQIAFAQEDISIVPASLVSEYMVGVHKAGNLLGPAADYGPQVSDSDSNSSTPPSPPSRCLVRRRLRRRLRRRHRSIDRS